MRIMLWGGRSKTRIVIDMISEIYPTKAEIIGIFDETLDELSFDTEIKLYSGETGLSSLYATATHFVVCIGGEHGFARYKISEKLKENGLAPIDLISSHGLLDKLDSCGDGIQVMPGAIAHKFTSIGSQCILNTNSTVDHECRLGNGVHIMGGASIAGQVEIGNFSTIGTNATVLPGLTLGNNVFVGAGAVVTENIKDNLVVAGVPAKTIKKFNPIFNTEIFEKFSP